MKTPIGVLTIVLTLLSCTKIQTDRIAPNEIQAVSTNTATTSFEGRPSDPVIVRQDFGFKPPELVAFSFINNAWVQIPVQVDEMASLDITKPYGVDAPTTGGYNILMYCDANQRTGADPNTSIDADDEIVFMLRDAGSEYSGVYLPKGVIAATKKQVTINDAGTYSYVYLFKQNGTLQQNAGVNYVRYDYLPLAPFVYTDNANAENSLIRTSKYKWHFSSEWVSDQIILNGADILDRQKSFVTDGTCGRTEQTFSDGENTFICNKSGCIRAIRSYMGANSGPYTQRTHLFYEGRQDIITDLRVHPIQGMHDVNDYNSNANGMLYTNSLNSTPKTINGVNEPVIKGSLQWELVSGNRGSLIILHRLKTTFTAREITNLSYWDDNKINPASNCTGDGQAWGTSGIGTGFNNSQLFTEPVKLNWKYTSPNFRLFQTTKVIYFEGPNSPRATAEFYNNSYNNLLQVSVL